MEAGVFAFVAFVAAFGCAFVVGRSVFLGFERAMAATRGVAYASQRARVRGAANGRGAGRFAILRARARDAVCRLSLYYVRNGVTSFLPPLQENRFDARWTIVSRCREIGDARRVDMTPEGACFSLCRFSARSRNFAACGVPVVCGGALCAGPFVSSSYELC